LSGTISLDFATTGLFTQQVRWARHGNRQVAVIRGIDCPSKCYLRARRGEWEGRERLPRSLSKI